MASLSSDLQAVLEALPHSVPAIIISGYQHTILNNADALDEVGSAKGASLIDRAALACKGIEILFGDRTITSQLSSYMEEQQGNWSVKTYPIVSAQR